MQKMTVIELSKISGLTRSQIYYQIRLGNIKINNGKIDYEEAINVISSLTMQQNKSTNEINFIQILNTIILQNSTLQKQLDLALEREKHLLSEIENLRNNVSSKLNFEDNSLAEGLTNNQSAEVEKMNAQNLNSGETPDMKTMPKKKKTAQAIIRREPIKPLPVFSKKRKLDNLT